MSLILIYIYVGFFLTNLLLASKQIVINIFKKFEIKTNVESRMKTEDNIHLLILWRGSGVPKQSTSPLVFFSEESR